MSGPDEELIHRMYEVFDLKATDELMHRYIHPDIEWHLPPNAPEPGPFRGLEGVRKVTGSFSESFESFSPAAEQIVPGSEPGQYVVLADVKVRGKGSGAELSVKVAHLLEIRDGKLARFQVFPDRADGLRAAGLDPADFT